MGKMREDAKAEETIDGLRDAFASQIRKAVAELPAHVALQLADSLCSIQLDVLAGLRVSYRARTPVDVAGIVADWRHGLSISEITAKHGCSRAKAYEHHPNRGRRNVS